MKVYERTLNIHEANAVRTSVSSGALRYLLRAIVDEIDKLQEEDYPQEYWSAIEDAQDLVQQAERILE